MMKKMTMTEMARMFPDRRFMLDHDTIEDRPVEDDDSVMERLYEASLTAAPDPDVVIGKVDVFKPCSLGECIGIDADGEAEHLAERVCDAGWNDMETEVELLAKEATRNYERELRKIPGFYVCVDTVSITAGDLAAWKEARDSA